MTLFDRSFFQDPYATFAQMRAETPVMKYRALSGEMWIVTRHADARDVLSRSSFLEYDLPSIIQQKRIVGPKGVKDFQDVGRRLERWLFFMHGVDHRSLRRALIPLYATSAVATAQKKIEAFVAAALEPVRDSLDYVETLAWPLPAVASTALLGLSLPPHAVTELASDVLKVFEPLQRVATYHGIEAGMVALDRLIQDLPAAESALTRLHEILQDRGLELTDQELRALAIMLFAAGQDTVAAAVGNAVYALAQDDRLLDQLRSNTALVPAAARELLRYDPPVQLIMRVAAVDQTIGEQFVRAGERICVALASANRDGEVFEKPDEIRFERTDGPSLTFGFGTHLCIGIHLATLVLETVLTTLARGPYLRLIQARRRESRVFRGFAQLVVAPRLHAPDV